MAVEVKYVVIGEGEENHELSSMHSRTAVRNVTATSHGKEGFEVCLQDVTCPSNAMH